MRVEINGEPREVAEASTILDLFGELGIDARKVALERNLEIVPRSIYANTVLGPGDKLEIVHFIGGGSAAPDVADAGAPGDTPLTVAGRQFRSRLIVGTGKYESFELNRDAVVASGAEMVTVAVRRVNISNPGEPMLVDYLDPRTYTYLPNTAGCYTGDDAVRTLRLAREAGGWNLVKLEVLGDEKTLYPNIIETLRAAELLIEDGFEVMVYCSDDPIMAKRLEEVGCCAIMPLAAPIGSGLGVQNPVNIRIIIEQAGRARDRRRRRRHRVRRDHRHGARMRRRVDEHRHRRGQGTGAHGARDETCGRGRPPGLPRGPHGEENLRRSLLAVSGIDLAAIDRRRGRANLTRVAREHRAGRPTGGLSTRAGGPDNDEAQAMPDLFDNPLGTDGFEFVEYAAPDPAQLASLFAQLGFHVAARHRSKDVTLYRQGEVNFIVNAEPDSFAHGFAAAHGPGVCAMTFRVADAAAAHAKLVENGATAHEGRPGPMELNIPAIEGIGGSLIYLVDRYGERTIYDVDFVATEDDASAAVGLTTIDHITHNVYRGNLDTWAGFYERLFYFREIRYFDIEGQLTGLISRAMTSPCGKIRIANRGIPTPLQG